MTPAEARDAFTRLLQTPEPELDLAEAALLIAAEEYPDLRPAVYLEQIARMGTELSRGIPAGTGPRGVAEPPTSDRSGSRHFKATGWRLWRGCTAFPKASSRRQPGLRLPRM